MLYLEMTALQQQIVRTLCYYDLFSHPLTLDEIFLFLPENSISRPSLAEALQSTSENPHLQRQSTYFYIAPSHVDVVALRHERERRARGRWRIARIVSSVIRRFPFVRGIFVSGDLAKNVTSKASDIDFVIITEPGRLWICRTLLILFKKIFLFNKKKFFCLNFFTASDHLECQVKNLFTATEVAHLKPLYNFPLFIRYMNANNWIKSYFPNYELFRNSVHRCSDSSSMLQKLLEFPFRNRLAERLDVWLMEKMEWVWKNRYPQLTEAERESRFRCSRKESWAFGREFGSVILSLYRARLAMLGLKPADNHG